MGKYTSPMDPRGTKKNGFAPMTLVEKSHHFPRGHRQIFWVRQKRDVKVFIWEKIGEVMFDFFVYMFFFGIIPRSASGNWML